MNTDGVKLNSLQKDLLRAGNNPKYWIALNETNKRQLYHHRAVLKSLLNKYSKNHHSEILEQIGREWEGLVGE